MSSKLNKLQHGGAKKRMSFSGFRDRVKRSTRDLLLDIGVDLAPKNMSRQSTLPVRERQYDESSIPERHHHFERQNQNSEEVVIAVMGMTGSGKTSFIKTVTSRSDIQVGDNLLSDTSEVRGYQFTHRDIDYVLVDTPGFNDSMMDNKVVTKKILEWLKSFGLNSHLHSIIIVHDISKRRLEGSATFKDPHFFRQLIQGNQLLNITLVTSFWDVVTPEWGARRESELLQSKDFWANMLSKGADTARIWPDRSICLQVLQKVGEKVRYTQSGTEASVDSLYESRNVTIQNAALQTNSQVENYAAELAEQRALEQRRLRSKLQEKNLNHRRNLDRLRVQSQRLLQVQEHKRRAAEEQAKRQDEIERKQRKQEQRELKDRLQRQHDIHEQERQRAEAATWQVWRATENLRLQEQRQREAKSSSRYKSGSSKHGHYPEYDGPIECWNGQTSLVPAARDRSVSPSHSDDRRTLVSTVPTCRTRSSSPNDRHRRTSVSPVPTIRTWNSSRSSSSVRVSSPFARDSMESFGFSYGSD